MALADWGAFIHYSLHRIMVSVGEEGGEVWTHRGRETAWNRWSPLGIATSIEVAENLFDGDQPTSAEAFECKSILHSSSRTHHLHLGLSNALWRIMDEQSEIIHWNTL